MREAMLIVHFIGLAMGAGTAIGFQFLGIASSRMEKKEGQNFMVKALYLGKMGSIGLVLLVVSGLYLMTPYWSTLGQNHTLMTKLVLVVILGALIGIISAKGKKAALGDAEMHLEKIGKIGKLALLTVITIIILAVLTFH
ncbi:MAG: putative membrane protein [Sphingobacteriales bacterium]|jgi:uncharacterized membrane protein